MDSVEINSLASSVVDLLEAKTCSEKCRCGSEKGSTVDGPIRAAAEIVDEKLVEDISSVGDDDFLVGDSFKELSQKLLDLEDRVAALEGDVSEMITDIPLDFLESEEGY